MGFTAFYPPYRVRCYALARNYQRTPFLTPDTTRRLARYFGGDAQPWLSLQTAYDLRIVERQVLSAIEREVLPREAA